MNENTKNSWDKRKNESDKAFEAFCRYRDAGADRSLADTAHQLKKSLALIKGWSAKHNWVDRAEDYDIYIDREEQKAIQKKRRAMARTQLRDADNLRKKALEALKSIDLEKISPRDIALYIRLAGDLEKDVIDRTKQSETAKRQEEAAGNTSLAQLIIEAYNIKDGIEGEGDPEEVTGKTPDEISKYWS